MHEDEREAFEQLRDAMVAQWRPRNVSAWLLVDQLARLQWRLMRAGDTETELLNDLQLKDLQLRGPFHRRAADPAHDRRERVPVGMAVANDVGNHGSRLVRLQSYQMGLERVFQHVLFLLMAMRKSRGKRGNLRRVGARKKSPQLMPLTTVVAQT